MFLYRDRVSLAYGFHRLRHAVKFLFRVCHKDNRYGHIIKALVIFPHIVHDFLNLFFLNPLVVRDFRGKIVVLVPHTLLLDDVRFNAEVFLLQNLRCHILWDRHYINACDGMYRKACDLIQETV